MDHNLSRAAGRGEILRVLPGVYTPLKPDFQQLIEAGHRWDATAIVCGRAAARLTFWPELPVERIFLSSTRRVSNRWFQAVRRTYPTDLTVTFGTLLSTRAEVAALELAPETLGCSLDEVLRRRCASVDSLYSGLALLPSRRGMGEIRRLLHLSREGAWSYAERLAHQLLTQAKITGWRSNHAVSVHGRQYVLDIAFRQLQLAIEINGRAYHSSAMVFTDDRVRDNALASVGWQVLRFSATWIEENPDEFIAVVRAAITRRRRQRTLLRA